MLIGVEKRYGREMERGNSAPEILVVIPTFERATLLPSAIESVLDQHYPALRLVIVDDGSTDSTSEVVASYHSRNPELVLYHRKENGGCASARNAGLSYIRGSTRFVCFLDSDDRMLPGKLEREVSLLEANPDAAFTYSDSVLYDDETGKTRIQKCAAAGRPQDFAIEHFTSDEAKSAAQLYRSGVFAAHRFREDLRLSEDSEFLQRVAMDYGAVYCAEPGCWVREHRGSKSRDRAALFITVHATRQQILRNYPAFHARHRRRAEQRIAYLAGLCFDELALQGRWDEATAYATTAGRRAIARMRLVTPIRIGRAVRKRLRPIKRMVTALYR